MDFEFKFSGGKELDRALGQLGTAIERTLGLKALRKGGRIISKAAKDNAPVDEGVLKKSIGVRAMPKRSGRIGVWIGSFRKGKKGAWYAHIIEFGSVRTQAKPFLRPALDQKAQEAVKVVGETLGDEIIKTARGLNKSRR